MNRYANLILSHTSIKPQTILEIGSRDAEDANFLHRFFKTPDNKVFIIEPNPAQQIIISGKFPDFNLFKVAIYNQEGNLKFNAVNIGDPGVSSLLDRYDNYYHNISKIIEVPTITGKKLLEIINQDIDLCKIDVEGATFEVLESFEEKIDLIKTFHIECEHIPVWKNQKLYPHVKRFLEKNHFKEIYFQYVNNIPQQSDSVWINEKFLK